MIEKRKDFSDGTLIAHLVTNQKHFSKEGNNTKIALFGFGTGVGFGQ
jgi:hypothetical protein